MGKLWCRDLPVATVPKSATPKAVTFVYPFYENHAFLWDQVEMWQDYDQQLRAHVSAIVVDDGSPTPAMLPPVLPFPVRLFRLEVDVRWNWLAARNIGAHHAADGWLLLTDMDHVVPAATLEALVYGQHDPRTVYAFQRREHDGTPIAPHSASFFMTREMFWRIGGYDETLSGFYGTDGAYRKQIAARTRMALLPDALVRYEYVGDSSTTRYERKQSIDAGARLLIDARQAGWRPKVLSFPYHEVTREVACR